jgi:hypothetical protein
LRTHTIAPLILPLLEAPAEDLFWNLLNFRRRIRCPPWLGNAPLEVYFQSREHLKVTRSEIRRVRWLGNDRNAFLGEELLHNKRCVARCVYTEPPVITQPSYSPDLAPNDLWLFPTLKMGFKGMRFVTMEDIECDGRTPNDS